MAGRERDGIATLSRIAEANPDLRGEITDTVAELHARLGEHDVAVGLLRQRHAEQTLRRPEHRDIGFYGSAAMVDGGLIGDRDLAYAWASDGQRLALQHGQPREVVAVLGAAGPVRACACHGRS